MDATEPNPYAPPRATVKRNADRRARPFAWLRFLPAFYSAFYGAVQVLGGGFVLVVWVFFDGRHRLTGLGTKLELGPWLLGDMSLPALAVLAEVSGFLALVSVPAWLQRRRWRALILMACWLPLLILLVTSLSNYG